MSHWKTKILLAAGGIVFVMLAAIIYASTERQVFDNAHLMSDVWFQTTLLDLYCAFGVFYLWVLSREPGIISRIIWLIAIACLGSLGIGLYLLFSLLTSKENITFAEFLTPQKSN